MRRTSNERPYSRTQPRDWAIVLDVPDATTGKKMRKWHSFKGTKRQAQVECSRFVAALNSGGYVEPTKQTVPEFLDEWLAFIKPSVSPKTHERYAEICQKGVAPLLSDVTLAKLKTDPDRRGILEGPSGRPQGRQGRTFAADGAPYASGAGQGPFSGCHMRRIRHARRRRRRSSAKR